MRDLKFTLIALAIFGAVLALMHTKVQNDRPDKATPVKVETKPQSTVDDWVVKPVSTQYLVSAPLDETTKWSGDESPSLEDRVAKLEKQMGEVKSDVSDLAKGQQDLTKRVEELTAFVEVRAKSGEVRTQAVKVSETGGTFKLNAGERIIAIDGVPVASSGGGGSNGSFTQSTTTMSYGSAPVAPQASGGSNGSLSYSSYAAPQSYASSPPPVTYSTQTYTATTSTSPGGTVATVQPRQPLLNGPLRNGGLRSGQPILQRRASAPQACVGPNCPN